MTATDPILAAPFGAPQCRPDQAPYAVHEHVGYSAGVPYLSGLPGQERPLLPGYDSGVVCLLLGVFLLLAANVRHYSTFLKTFTHDLLQVRRRANAFDDHTLNETRITLAFAVLVCVCEGILLYSAPWHTPAHTDSPFRLVGLFSAMALAYYVWQLVAYRVVGSTFAGDLEASQWLKGFNASQALLGLGLAIPALLVLFDPAMATGMCILGAILYIMARLIFIFKGFRIFYTHPASLLYFILYLCTLEIVPLSIIYHAGTALIAIDHN